MLDIQGQESLKYRDRRYSGTGELNIQDQESSMYRDLGGELDIQGQTI